MKNIVTEVSGPVLQFYDLSKLVTLQADASQSGLGAVLLQDDKPVAYASKVLTLTQQAYAQIEKEALALVFRCEKFHHYLYGRDFVAETDHKTLKIFDASALQNDLSNFQDDSSRVNLELNSTECKVLRVTRKHNKITYPYKLNDAIIESTDCD